MSNLKPKDVTATTTDTTETSDTLLKNSTIAVGTLALSACGGTGFTLPTDEDILHDATDNTGLYPDTSQRTVDPYTFPSSEQQAARFLQKAGFSSTPDEVSYLMTMSYSDWLEEQFTADIEQTLWEWRTSGLIPDDGYNHSSSKGDYDGTLKDMFTAKDVLRKRMALALLQIFVIGDGLWAAHDGWGKCDYWDMLNEHSFGNFKDLLMDVTRHPMMMKYLTSFNSRAEVDGENHKPDENYAREVMQLFSIGLIELNIDGSAKLDVNGNEIPTYNQDTIVNLARVFTGYGWHGDSDENYPDYARDPVIIRDVDGISWHSLKDKTFLGETIPGDTDQLVALEWAIDIIFNHDNVGPFIANLLIQRFVTSNPSPGYISRVATIFNENDEGERGNLRSVLSAILLDEEALRIPNEEEFNFLGKVREPMLRLAQWYRTFGGYTVSGNWEAGYIASYTYGIGQMPFKAPSVFNHYYPDFAPREGFEDTPFVAPEIQILDEVSIAGYLNFLWFLLNVGILHKSDNTVVEIAADYATENTLIENANNYVEHLNLHLCGGRLSTETVADIVSAVEDRNFTHTTGLTGDDLSGAERVNAERRNIGISLVMSCPEYLVQV